MSTTPGDYQISDRVRRELYAMIRQFWKTARPGGMGFERKWPISPSSFGGKYGTGTKACSSGSWTIIDFGTSDHEASSDLDLAGTGVITFNSPGVYRIRGEVSAYGQYSSDPFKVQIALNGSGVGPIMHSMATSDSVAGYCGITAIIEIAESDFVQIQVDGDVDVFSMSITASRTGAAS